MKVNFFIVFTTLILLSCSCESNSNKNEVDIVSCDSLSQWSLIEPILLNDSLALKLNKIFSDENSFMSRSKDTALFIINTQEEFSEICSETLNNYLSLDTVTIIGVKLLTSSISDTISSVSLFQCNNVFNFEIEVNHCSECWLALENQYAWQVFKDITIESSYSLMIK